MKTVQGIIEAHGGIEGLKRQYLRIERPGYMRLVIEYIGTGPRKLPLISVAHYGEQNGDAMRDPDMTFEVADDSITGRWRWLPVTFRDDYAGIDQEAIFTDETGRVLIRPKLVTELVSFSRVWDRNIKAQGFADAVCEVMAS